VSAKLILDSQEKHQINLMGPVHVDPSWQSRTPDAFDASQFQIDWQAQSATCPQGQKSLYWQSQFKSLYRKRSGIEGTLSQAIRSSDLRRARYMGQAKTHLQNVAIAVATNIKRLKDWLNEIPLASTRHACFTFLLLPA
jgi:transposase